jgi:hypothetical protein
VADRERGEPSGQPAGGPQAIPAAGDDEAAAERSGRPQSQQRSGGRGGPAERLRGGGHGDLVGPEEDAEREQSKGQRADRRRAQRAAAVAAVRDGRRRPRACGRLHGERDRRDEQDDSNRRERAAGRPDRAEAENQRRAGDPRELVDRGLERVGADESIRVGDEGGKPGAQRRADRWRGQPDADRQQDQHDDRGMAGRERDRSEQGGLRACRHREDAPVSVPVDQPPERRAAETDRKPVGTRDDAGRGERSGQLPGVHHQPDPEHRVGEPGGDREREQASERRGAAARG